MTKVPKLNFPKEQLLEGGEALPERQPTPAPSQYMGVTFSVARKKWRAYHHMPTSKVQKSFGYYASEEDAARARDRSVLHMVEQV